eukprot:1147587-Heterocapsa_arctica.AAC.1
MYHSAVGKLMWLIQERPDLSYAIEEMSRAVQSPCVRHWGAMKKALRYIAGTMDYALYYDIDVKADDDVH